MRWDGWRAELSYVKLIQVTSLPEIDEWVHLLIRQCDPQNLQFKFDSRPGASILSRLTNWI
jgi:hypothetical protein